MRILTINTYFKVGLLALIKDEHFYRLRKIVIFDALNYMYVRSFDDDIDYSSLDLYDFLTFGTRFFKSDKSLTIESLSHFFSRFFETNENEMQFIHPFKKITEEEKNILSTFCKDVDSLYIEKLFGKKICEVQNRKYIALNKLGFSNFKQFYLTQSLWNKSMKNI